jgi:hypothetical protein
MAIVFKLLNFLEVHKIIENIKVAQLSKPLPMTQHRKLRYKM